jgi:hypothetical protein
MPLFEAKNGMFPVVRRYNLLRISTREKSRKMERTAIGLRLRDSRGKIGPEERVP